MYNIFTQPKILSVHQLLPPSNVKDTKTLYRFEPKIMIYQFIKIRRNEQFAFNFLHKHDLAKI